MKFSTLFTTAVSLFSIARAVDIELSNPGDSEGVQGEYLDTEEHAFKYLIDYQIVGKPRADVLELYNGEEVTLEFEFINNEEEEISIVGVGGHFANPTNGELVANITDANVGPLVIPAGESGLFSQRVGINLPADNYLLSPGIYVVKGTTLALLGARTQLTIVDEPPISFFNPQLVLLELILLATLGLVGYIGWVTFGANYFKSTVSTANISKSASKNAARSTGSEKKTVDESWLPESHIKKTNKRKAK